MSHTIPLLFQIDSTNSLDEIISEINDLIPLITCTKHIDFIKCLYDFTRFIFDYVTNKADN